MNGIIENLVSELIWWSFLILVGLAIYWFARRSKLLNFFGVRKNRRFIVYMSKLQVDRFGSRGLDSVRYSYQGSAAPKREFELAIRFRDLFNFAFPSLSDQPGFLSKLLFSDVRVQILLSPPKDQEPDKFTSFLTLGGPGYNLASNFVELDLNSWGKFATEPVDQSPSGAQEPSKSESTPEGSSASQSSATTTTTVINIQSDNYISDGTLNPDYGEPAPSGIKRQVTGSRGITNITESDRSPFINIESLDPIRDPTFGFVERIFDQDRNRSVFYAAGLSEIGTAGAANFLASEWGKLNKKFGDKTHFLVMLKIDPSDINNWEKIFER